VIRVENFAKRFGTVAAARTVSFAADDGAVTALIGANGSGKTTTLRAVAGLLKADGGRIAIDGIDVGAARLRAARRLGFMPDGAGLYPELTAREHVALFARLHGLAGAKLRRATDAAIETLGLGAIANRRTRGFSSGERMRVALARAIVHAPQNVILDEPARGLDVFGIRLLRDLVRALKARGACVLLSSHVLSDVEVLADAAVILDRGEVRAAGAPGALMRRYGADTLEDAFVKATA